MPKSSIANCTPSARTRADDVEDGFGVVHQHALGDLEAQARRPHAGLGDHLGHPLGEIGLHELAGREVDRDLERLGLLELPARRVAAPPPRAPTSPIGTTRPVSSASGMNSAGAISPRSGCCQRSSASAPTQRASERLTIGWKKSRNSPRSKRAVQRVLGRVRA